MSIEKFIKENLISVKYPTQIQKDTEFWDVEGILKNRLNENLKFDLTPMLDNIDGSKSKKFLNNSKADKLVYDYNNKFYIVDANELRYFSDKNRKNILIPPYFLNAHLCLYKECLFHYKLSYKGKYNDTNNQLSVPWNDPRIKIKWPIKNPILSPRI